MQDNTATPDHPAYPAVYRYLMATGLLGSMHGLADDARTVSSAMEQTMTVTREYRLCQALAQSLSADPGKARATVESHLDTNPDDAQAQVIFAATLMRAGDPQWKPVLDMLLATSVDPVVRQTAQDLLRMAEAAAEATA